MDKRLLEILVCPVSGAALTLLDPSEQTALNQRIRDGGARYADGAAVHDPLDAGLITADGCTVYRIDDDIPVLLPELGIANE
ncbi:MAG: Trm112 family protein [Salinisphaera sp.]|nr:Trm112 family protein [Salinisphaera sp.]MDN5938857.1 Trm112 family protein [Salinisphaera sp.]